MSTWGGIVGESNLLANLKKGIFVDKKYNIIRIIKGAGINGTHLEYLLKLITKIQVNES